MACEKGGIAVTVRVRASVCYEHRLFVTDTGLTLTLTLTLTVTLNLTLSPNSNLSHNTDPKNMP